MADPATARIRGLDGPPSDDEVPDEDDDADDQQQMDEPARNMEGEEAQRPQDQKDDCDGKKHGQSLGSVIGTRA